MVARTLNDRFELKYLTRFDTYQRIIRQLDPYAERDGYAGELGRYSIISLYYDSPELACYWDKINGVPYRNKLRIRQYGSMAGSDDAYIEVKQKLLASIRKIRTRMKLTQAYDLLAAAHQRAETSEVIDRSPEDEVLNHVMYLRSLYNLEPKAIISYEREPYVGRYDHHLRMTFDLNLRSRAEDLRLESGPWGKYIMSPDIVLVEMKVDGRIPEWFISLVAEHNLEPCRFSKYCLGLERALSLQSQEDY
jgi:SPX domain protein involved in polyphosphate accumulation